MRNHVRVVDLVFDLNKEQGNSSNNKFIKDYMDTEQGKMQLKRFLDALI